MKTKLFTNTGIALIALLASCVKQPEATFTASKTTPITGEEISFTNSSTDAVSYSWDFGDSKTSTEKNPKHTYDKFGTYTVKFIANSKKDKKSDEATTTITVGKNTKEKLTQTWKFNTASSDSYEDNVYVASYSFIFTVMKMQFNSNGQFVATDEDGIQETGSWSLINDTQISIYNEVWNIVSISETNLTLKVTSSYHDGGVYYTDVIIYNLSKL